MTRSECIEVLRDGAEYYESVANLLWKFSGGNIAAKPIDSVMCLQLYALHAIETKPPRRRKETIYRWREAAFPLWYAIEKASEGIYPQTNIYDKINYLFPYASVTRKMQYVCTMALIVMEDDPWVLSAQIKVKLIRRILNNPHYPSQTPIRFHGATCLDDIGVISHVHFERISNDAVANLPGPIVQLGSGKHTYISRHSDRTTVKS